jgi:hypothetical protein
VLHSVVIVLVDAFSGFGGIAHILAELELLQDRIPPFSDVEALQVCYLRLSLNWLTSLCVSAHLSGRAGAAAAQIPPYNGVEALQVCCTGCSFC